MKESILRRKTDNFADRIVKLYNYLCDIKKENILSKQVLRSGTSIGANVSEASFAASKRDFVNKMHIAAKECSETLYWLGRLRAGKFIDDKGFDSLYKDGKEIGCLLSASIQTAKNNLDS